MGDSGGRMGDSVEGGLGEEIVMGGKCCGKDGRYSFVDFLKLFSQCINM